MTNEALVKRGELPTWLEEFAKLSLRMDDRIRGVLQEVYVPAGRRYGVASGCFFASIEHGTGVRAMIRTGHPAPGLALLRPQIEALLRGDWAWHVADDAWLLDFITPRGDALEGAQFAKRPEKLLEDLAGKAPEKTVKAMTTLVSDLLPTLHSLTHGGLRQIAGVVHGYSYKQIVGALRISNRASMLTLGECLQLCQVEQPAILHEVNRILDEFKECATGPSDAPWETGGA